MKRWYEDKDEAVYAARYSGFRVWEVTKVNDPTWGPQWWRGMELTKTLSSAEYRCVEVEKDTQALYTGRTDFYKGWVARYTKKPASATQSNSWISGWKTCDETPENLRLNALRVEITQGNIKESLV